MVKATNGVKKQKQAKINTKTWKTDKAQLKDATNTMGEAAKKQQGKESFVAHNPKTRVEIIHLVKTEKYGASFDTIDNQETAVVRFVKFDSPSVKSIEEAEDWEYLDDDKEKSGNEE